MKPVLFKGGVAIYKCIDVLIATSINCANECKHILA